MSKSPDVSLELFKTGENTIISKFPPSPLPCTQGWPKLGALSLTEVWKGRKVIGSLHHIGGIDLKKLYRRLRAKNPVVRGAWKKGLEHENWILRHWTEVWTHLSTGKEGIWNWVKQMSIQKCDTCLVEGNKVSQCSILLSISCTYSRSESGW